MDFKFILRDGYNHYHLYSNNTVVIAVNNSNTFLYCFELRNCEVYYNDLDSRFTLKGTKQKIDFKVSGSYTKEASTFRNSWAEQRKQPTTNTSSQLETELQDMKNKLQQTQADLKQTQEQLHQSELARKQLTKSYNDIAQRAETASKAIHHQPRRNETQSIRSTQITRSANAVLSKQQGSTRPPPPLSTQSINSSDEKHKNTIERETDPPPAQKNVEMELAKQKDYETKYHQLVQINQQLSEEFKFSEAALHNAQTQMSLLSAKLVKLNGMCIVGDTATECKAEFKKLYDTLDNIVFDLGSSDADSEKIFAIFSKIAFHGFWAVVMQSEEDVTQEAKMHAAKIVLSDEKTVQAYATLLTLAANNAVSTCADLEQPAQCKLDSELYEFYVKCTRWNASMTLCDPIIELLPKDRIPKRGTPLNDIPGQQFEFNFGDEGRLALDCVVYPGLRVLDFKGTILHRAKLKCYFPRKK